MVSYFKQLSPELRWAQEAFNKKKSKKGRNKKPRKAIAVPLSRSKPASAGPRRNGVPRKPNDGYEQGMAAEERFFRICAEFKAKGRFPHWLLEIVFASHQDDSNGTDGVAVTITEDFLIPVQVKSSYAGKEKFREYAEWRHIVCIVVNFRRSDEEIFAEALDELSYIWEMMQLTKTAAE